MLSLTKRTTRILASRLGRGRFAEKSEESRDTRLEGSVYPYKALSVVRLYAKNAKNEVKGRTNGQEAKNEAKRKAGKKGKANVGNRRSAEPKIVSVEEELRKASEESRRASGKSIEELYERKSPIEHILLRPDTYIGSLVKTKQMQWVYQASKGVCIQRECTYVPGLYKIFDEILVNAADHRQRDPLHMKTIRVDIDSKEGIISVYNDGAGIPVQIHKKEGVYLPELLLGHLLTGSNFNDNIAKVTGGRNGYGAKLANIFSSKFSVETFDHHTGLFYKQSWSEHMEKCEEPEILQHRPIDLPSTAAWKCENGPTSGRTIETPDSPFYYGSSGGFTRITFQPDLKLFGMKKLQGDDILLVMKRRVYDLAACLPGVNVFLDGTLLPSNFERLYAFSSPSSPSSSSSSSSSSQDMLFANINERWTVGIGATVSPSHLTQVSFVNCINTLNGGAHVNYIADQVVKYVVDAISKKRVHKNVGKSITPASVKNHLVLVVRCLIENPAFDSQTKERLMTKQENFGSTCLLEEKFLKEAVAKSGLIEIVASQVEHMHKQALARTAHASKRNKLLGIPKLDDANEAGGPRSKECTLIITEGDSAKSLAVSGLSIVGRDLYGVFPVQGKILNVREAPTPKVVENKEIKDLIQAIGLNPQRSYSNWESDSATLRYGKVMLMADQDPDGSHIKGLFINFLHHFWPNLLKQDGFLFEFVTPLIKATKKSALKARDLDGLGEIDTQDLSENSVDAVASEDNNHDSKESNNARKRGKSNQSSDTISFFTMAEYEKWKQTVDPRQWSVKYYKGLGTSTSAEAREYFSNLKKHVVKFEWKPEADALIDMAFNKKFAAERRMWLLGYDSTVSVDTSKGILDYASFINKELIAFSAYDNLRSIPSVVDGLKPSQRKVLYASFKRKLFGEEIKVVQLAGYVSEQAGYHHGEASLHGTIVNMAQTFVGSNNVPLLVPSGQFGTRLQGGKDAASARYIFTRLSRYARLLFPEDDDPLLNYLDDDGYPIEPQYYVPIIPLLLVNGAEGVGTGWSSKVPSYHPLQLISNIRSLLDNHASQNTSLSNLQPFYRGFKGYTKAHYDRKIGVTSSPPPVTSSEQSLNTEKQNNGKISSEESLSEEKKETKNSQTQQTPSNASHSSSNTSETIQRNHSTAGNAKSMPSTSWSVPSSWTTQGVFTRTQQGQLRIVELPVGRWTNDYKAFLEQLVKEKRYVKEYAEYHTDEAVSFLITPIAPEVLDTDKHIIERFKLEDWIHERNMSAFDASGSLQKYSTPNDILRAHFDVRLALYERRKQFKIAQLSHTVSKLSYQTKFTDAVLSGELQLLGQPKSSVFEKLSLLGIPPFDLNATPSSIASSLSSKSHDSSNNSSSHQQASKNSKNKNSSSSSPSYSYLLSTPLLHLTREHVEKLKHETEQQQRALEILQATSPTQLWRDDLDKLEAVLKLDKAFTDSPLTPGAKPKIPPLSASSPSSSSSRAKTSSKHKNSNAQNKKSPNQAQNQKSDAKARQTSSQENKTSSSQASKKSNDNASPKSSDNKASSPKNRGKGGAKRSPNMKTGGRTVTIKIHPEDHL